MLRHILSLTRLILLTGLSLPAFAGNRENFAACTKGNDCKSLQCFQKRCEPSTIWTGHGKNGTYCESNSHCESRNCVKRECTPKEEAAKAPEKRETSRDQETRGTATSPSRPAATRPARDSDDGDNGAAPDAKQEPVEMNACAKDIRATFYEDDFNGMFAHDNDQLSADICTRYDAKTIATAKALTLAKYGTVFSETLREIENKSDKEIECGKKVWDARPVDARDVPFKVPVSCSGQTKAELERCVSELGPVKLPAAQAKMLCATYEPDTIRKAKQLVSSGYKGDFLMLCRQVDHHSDQEIACAKKTLDDLFRGQAEEYAFSVNFECAEPLVKH